MEGEVVDKWVHSFVKSEDDSTKTEYWIKYSFCYQDIIYEMNHRIANHDSFLSIYNLMQIGQTIPILFYAENPTKYNLPKMAMDSPVRKYVMNVIVGSILVLFAISFSILLIWMLDERVTDFICILNLLCVTIIYPLVALIGMDKMKKRYSSKYEQAEEHRKEDEKQTGQTSTVIVYQHAGSSDETEQFM